MEAVTKSNHLYAEINSYTEIMSFIKGEVLGE